MRMEPPPSEPVASGTMPAARAAAAPPEEPPGPWAWSNGFSGRAEDGVGGVAAPGELGGVGLADDDAAGRPQAGDEGMVVVGGRVVGVERRAVGGAVADGVLGVLDAEGDAGQRPGVVAGGDALVEGGGLGRARSPSTATKAL